MNQVIWLAIIGGVQLLLLTAANAIIAARKDKRDALQKAAERKEDYERQDLVAARVAAAAAEVTKRAELLIESQKEVARVAAESDTRTRGALQAIDQQTKKIHVLVNGDMTAARENERDQTRLTLLALKRVQALSQNLGLPVNEDEICAIQEAEARIDKLDGILADRHAAQKSLEEAAALGGRRVDDRKETA
jgi:hypothetical protein